MIKDKDIYRLRAMEILKGRIAGMSIQQLAEKFNCHPDTIVRSTAWAKREGLVESYENKIISDLVPEAMKVYMETLAADDEGNRGADAFFAAKDVMDKLFKLGDRFQVKETAQEAHGLTQYLAEKRQKAASEPKVVQGKVIESDAGKNKSTTGTATVEYATSRTVANNWPDEENGANSRHYGDNQSSISTPERVSYDIPDESLPAAIPEQIDEQDDETGT